MPHTEPDHSVVKQNVIFSSYLFHVKISDQLLLFALGAHKTKLANLIEFIYSNPPLYFPFDSPISFYLYCRKWIRVRVMFFHPQYIIS